MVIFTLLNLKLLKFEWPGLSAVGSYRAGYLDLMMINRNGQGRACVLHALQFALVLALASSAAGSLAQVPGQFSVSYSGAATYSIPIQVPPAVAGMSPKPGLAYNSQSGNGLFGVGWSLSGLSSITRCPRSLLQDNVRAPLKLDLSDRYCLDGQRLIAVSGSDGVNGTQYRTELEGYGKVVSYTDASVTNGPASFVVTTKAGLIMEYGKTADAQVNVPGKTVVSSWALNKVIDARGNYYTITYKKNAATGEQFPSQMDYGTSSIKFIDEARPDVDSGYQQGGSYSSLSRRVGKIQTYVGTNMVWEYRLTYQISPATSRSVLAQVQLCSAAGTCFAPTSVASSSASYGLTNYINTAVSGSFIPASSGYNRDAGVWLDANNDGIVDYLVAWKTGASGRALATYLGNKNGTFNTNFVNTVVEGTFCPTDGSSQQDIGRFLDVTGDGIADYVLAWRSGSARVLSTYVGNSDGSFQPAARTSYVDGNYIQASSSSNQDSGMFIDLNGDGLPDYAVVWQSTGGARAIAVYLNKGDGTFNNLINTTVDGNFIPTASGSNVDTGSFVDVNGDGIPDYVVPWSAGGARALAVYIGQGNGTFANMINTTVDGSFIPASSGSNQDAGTFADVNGDGLADYVVVWKSAGGGRSIAAYLSKGDGTFANMVNTTVDGSFLASGSNSNKEAGLFMDVNGDGMSDYVLVWKSSQAGARSTSVFLAKSGGAFANAYTLTPNGSFIPVTSTSNEEVGSFADVNGDGVSDYAVAWNVNGQRNLAVYLGVGQGDMATTISDGLGSSRTIGYTTLAQSLGQGYVRDIVSAYPRLVLSNASQVVSSVSASNGLGGSLTSSYAYGNQVVDLSLTGRGSLGFQWTQTKDNATGLVGRTYYRQDFPYIGMVDKAGRGTTEANWSNLSLSTNEYSFKAFLATDTSYASPVTCTDTQSDLATCKANAIKPGNRYIAYPSKVVEKSWDWNDQSNVFTALPQKRTSTVVNNWADPTQIKVEVLDANGAVTGFSKTTDTVYSMPDVASWKLDRVIKSSVTAVAP